MDQPNRPPEIAVVIEPEVGQFIGARLLFLSLRRVYPKPEFRLCVVDRGPASRALVELGQELGWDARPCVSTFTNPYLNKWLCLEAFKALRECAHLVLLDWDILFCGSGLFPGPFQNGIAARRNPPNLYRRLLTKPQLAALARRGINAGCLPSSINSGVLIGTGSQMTQGAARTIAREKQLADALPAWEPWKREQLACSIALGESAFVALPEIWNSTAQSSAPDADVQLWHYNDGCEATLAIKRNLPRPEIVQAQLDGLAKRWPRTVANFRGLYQRVAGEDWFPGASPLGTPKARKPTLPNRKEIEKILVLCCAEDLWLAKLCVASIRFWYPGRAVTLVKDLTRGPFSTLDLEHFWNVDCLTLPNPKCGAGFAKIELLLRDRPERFLLLDADTIVCGRVLELLERVPADFIVSKRSAADPFNVAFRKAYFDLARLREMDPEFEYPGFAFNTGAWVATSGLLQREMFTPYLIWGSPISLRHPGIFSCADQGLLNYLLLDHARRGKISLATAEFMRWGHASQKAPVPLPAVESRQGHPCIIHYAGAKPTSLRDFHSSDLLEFYERHFYSRLRPGAKPVHSVG